MAGVTLRPVARMRQDTIACERVTFCTHGPIILGEARWRRQSRLSAGPASALLLPGRMAMSTRRATSNMSSAASGNTD
jgi:hypothetical protein